LPYRRAIRTLDAMVDGGDRLDLPGALWALRRRADLSQRELAARSGVPSATIGSVESGASPNPAFRTVERLVAATGARVAILDLDGSEPVAPDIDDHLDRACRRLPAHLDPHWVTWRGTRRLDRWGFVRNRRDRDRYRRMKAREERGDLDYQVRRLGPGDTAVLETLRTDASGLDLAGRAAPDRPPLTTDEAVRYLRDPSQRHWIAEAQTGYRVLGHLAAHLHLSPVGHPTMAVVAFGIRPEHRDGLVGIRLVAAMSDEAALLGVEEIVALADDPAVARQLRRLGFRRRRPRRPPLLCLPG
jgi:transcriptional regulator with XRE-family HTH domain